MFVVLDLQWKSMGKGIAGDLKSEMGNLYF